MLVLAALLAGLAGRACGDPSVYELLIEESPSKAGTVEPNSGTHRFGATTTVTLSADPQPGYQFAYWLGDVSDPKAPRTTVKVNESKVIVAVFRPAERKRPEEEVKTSGGGGGGLLLVNGSSDGGYQERHLAVSFHTTEAFFGFQEHGARPAPGHVRGPPVLHVAAELSRSRESAFDQVGGAQRLAQLRRQGKLMQRQRVPPQAGPGARSQPRAGPAIPFASSSLLDILLDRRRDKSSASRCVK